MYAACVYASAWQPHTYYNRFNFLYDFLFYFLPLKIAVAEVPKNAVFLGRFHMLALGTLIGW